MAVPVCYQLSCRMAILRTGAEEVDTSGSGSYISTGHHGKDGKKQEVNAMPNAFRLDGQVAIVTGAAQGIGQGIALALSEAGAKVVIGDIQDAGATVEKIESSGGRVAAMVMDTSVSTDAEALVDLALTEFGRLDALVKQRGHRRA